VVPLVFKTSERRAASLAGSIPVRLRHQRGLRASRQVTGLDRHGAVALPRGRRVQADADPRPTHEER
jgi:hypothetical protein